MVSLLEVLALITSQFVQQCLLLWEATCTLNLQIFSYVFYFMLGVP